MTLLDIMKEVSDENLEITVHDVDYDMETYFYGRNSWQDEKEWIDSNDVKLASVLDVKDLYTDETGKYVATVNLSEVVERNLDKIDHLFANPDINAIMDDMQNILAGYVSEEWMHEFVSGLTAGDERYIEEKIRVPEPEQAEKLKSNDEFER